MRNPNSAIRPLQQSIPYHAYLGVVQKPGATGADGPCRQDLNIGGETAGYQVSDINMVHH